MDGSKNGYVCILYILDINQNHISKPTAILGWYTEQELSRKRSIFYCNIRLKIIEVAQAIYGIPTLC